MEIIVPGMSTGYKTIIDAVIASGERTSPRGMPTLEIRNAQIIVENPLDAFPTRARSGLNRRIAFAEGLQLLAGRSFPELMVRIAPNFANFTNGGVWFHGAYGPRIRTQIPKILRLLHQDIDSRQAYVSIWDPNYDGYGDVADTPCTLGLHVQVRDGRLFMTTMMRSNDVWWGVPYDIYQFTTLQRHLAAVLGLSPGRYVHQAASLHVYERDLERASQTVDGVPLAETGLIVRAGWTWEMTSAVAEAILKNKQHPLESTAGAMIREHLHG